MVHGRLSLYRSVTLQTRYLLWSTVRLSLYRSVVLLTRYLRGLRWSTVRLSLYRSVTLLTRSLLWSTGFPYIGALHSKHITYYGPRSGSPALFRYIWGVTLLTRYLLWSTVRLSLYRSVILKTRYLLWSTVRLSGLIPVYMERYTPNTLPTMVHGQAFLI